VIPGALTFHAIRTNDLAGQLETSYSAGMQWIVESVLGAVVLAFCAMVYVAARSWPKIGTGRRIAGLLLLVPHFLLVACIPFALRTGNAPQGSARFNQGFAADVFMVFLLPVPAFIGSLSALFVFLLARPADRLKAASSAPPTNRP